MPEAGVHVKNEGTEVSPAYLRDTLCWKIVLKSPSVDSRSSYARSSRGRVLHGGALHGGFLHGDLQGDVPEHVPLFDDNGILIL